MEVSRMGDLGCSVHLFRGHPTRASFIWPWARGLAKLNRRGTVGSRCHSAGSGGIKSRSLLRKGGSSREWQVSRQRAGRHSRRYSSSRQVGRRNERSLLDTRTAPTMRASRTVAVGHEPKLVNCSDAVPCHFHATSTTAILKSSPVLRRCEVAAWLWDPSASAGQMQFGVSSVSRVAERQEHRMDSKSVISAIDDMLGELDRKPDSIHVQEARRALVRARQSIEANPGGSPWNAELVGAMTQLVMFGIPG